MPARSFDTLRGQAVAMVDDREGGTRAAPIRLRHLPPGGAAALRRTGPGTSMPFEEIGP